MEANGLVTRDGDRYARTGLGQRRRAVLAAIGQWAAPLMGPQEPDEAYRSHWIEYPMTARFPGEDRSRPDLTIEVRCGERPMTVRSVEGRVRVEPGPAAAPDLVLTGPADAVLGLLTHQLTVEQAMARGLAVTGDARPLRRLHPNAAAHKGSGAAGGERGGHERGGLVGAVAGAPGDAELVVEGHRSQSADDDVRAAARPGRLP